MKTDTIWFKVSKKAKEYFTNHANGAYGSTQKAMESLFKSYMESIVFKTGKINGRAVLLVPKFNSRGCLEKINDSQIIDFDDDGFWSEKFLDKFTLRLEDDILEDVVVKSYSTSDGITKLDRKYFNENLEIDGFYVDIEEYIAVPFYFNNHLDSFKDGVYRNIGSYGHSGLIISIYGTV